MDKKIAVLVAEGFEEVELTSPVQAMKDEGFQVEIISEKKGKIRSWDEDKWGKEYEADAAVAHVKAKDYDALVVPGGVINPDKMRRNEVALKFVKDFFEQGKPVASLCHGPQVLISAGVVEGRKMTSFYSIKDDLINAGAKWEDSEVVVDQGLVTSRSPKDLKAFNSKLIEEIKEGKHNEQHA